MFIMLIYSEVSHTRLCSRASPRPLEAAPACAINTFRSFPSNADLQHHPALSQPAVRPQEHTVLATSPGHVALLSPSFSRESRVYSAEGNQTRTRSDTTHTNMNIFRLTGDLSHLAAIIILLLKIWKTRSCAGECSDSDPVWTSHSLLIC